jgi:3-(3-hydroxy-phenyl)propionate hydroxylase
MNSTRSTDFITPKSRTSRTFRNAVLDLARHHPFARKLVNSGRLSVPSFLTHSALNTPDTDASSPATWCPARPWTTRPCNVDGQDRWLLDQLGNRFQCLLFVDAATGVSDTQRAALAALATGPIPVQALLVSPAAVAGRDLPVLVDTQGLVARRYDARPGTTYLVRPDQHVAARWRAFDAAAVRAAVARATCNA